MTTPTMGRDGDALDSAQEGHTRDRMCRRCGRRHQWRLEVYAPDEWLTANIERHRQARSRKVRAWREATVAACHNARLPLGITPVNITAVVLHAGRAPVRDRLNLAPTLKAIVDGLTPARTFKRDGKTYTTAGYGFLPDDSDRHVTGPTWELERTHPQIIRGAIGRVDLTITEVL